MKCFILRKWMEQESILLNKSSQIQKDIYEIWGLVKDIK